MIPYELTQYPQWVCWRYSSNDKTGKLTKLPYNVNGQLASAIDPTTWTDYSTACQAALNGGYSGIGFVLTETDPYCFIDLDDPGQDTATINRHNELLNSLDSYSEISPSGKGLHIICRGSVPSGRRRNKVEVYSSARYMTVTGQTYQDKPIGERNFILNTVWNQLGDSKTSFIIQDQPQRYSDDEIYRVALGAENGEKFEALWSGDWQKYFAPPKYSQSEADFALIDILGFYSRNIEQIKRMFRASALGQRDKAKREKYLQDMIKASFDNLPPEVPLEQMILKFKQELDEKRQEPAVALSNPFAGPLFENLPDDNYDWTMPPGLLGEIAQFVYASAPRPVKEIALAAAIGLMAGICGRCYNISGTGLNQYILVLAETGVGKEALANGIDKLIQRVRLTVPAALDFVGPAEIASGVALTKYLQKHPCFVSVVGEFGLLLQQICSPAANLSQIQLRRVLLALYNKSGENDCMRATIYSDQDKNTQVVKSPSFSLLGESTPSTFFASLDESMIAQGLMPRFTCIEYAGNVVSLNEDHFKIEPPPELVDRVGELAANALMLATGDRIIQVTMDAEATAFARALEKKCTKKINTSEQEISRQLWNRVHIKTLKLCALIAIGLNPYSPVVTLDGIVWASQLIERDVKNILSKFESGKAGKETGELNQINEMVRLIKNYVVRPYGGLEKYLVPPEFHRDRVIPLAYLQRRMMQKNSFRNDRMGATSAIKRCIEALVSEGSLTEVRQLDLHRRYGKTMKAYYVADVKRFS